MQELRPAPVVPYLHGFTVPTSTKDPEMNACFKQVLLRPHQCKGPGHCRKVDCADAFCKPVIEDPSTSRITFTKQWRQFHAEQLVLAEHADRRRASPHSLRSRPCS